MKTLMSADAAFARAAIKTGKATDDEIAFFDTMCGMEAAREPVTEDEYRHVQRLTGGYLGEDSIFERK